MCEDMQRFGKRLTESRISRIGSGIEVGYSIYIAAGARVALPHQNRSVVYPARTPLEDQKNAVGRPMEEPNEPTICQSFGQTASVSLGRSA
jgi:hypothetical protein